MLLLRLKCEAELDVEFLASVPTLASSEEPWTSMASFAGKLWNYLKAAESAVLRLRYLLQ